MPKHIIMGSTCIVGQEERWDYTAMHRLPGAKPRYHKE
jgi:hypothetical protein